MEQQDNLAQNDINKIAEQFGLQKSNDEYIMNVDQFPESELQAQIVELERRGFKRREKEETNSKTIAFIYDASLSAPRG